jgi:hypothetical protein
MRLFAGSLSLGIISVYLRGIDSAEIIDSVHARCAPMMPVSTSLRLGSPAESQRCSSRIAIATALELPSCASSRSPALCLWKAPG